MKRPLPLFAGLLLILNALILPQIAAAVDVEVTSKKAGEVENKRPPVGLSGVELKEIEEDYKAKPKRFILPPYYSEKTDRQEFKALFPFFYFRERTGEGARTDMGLLPFYWRYREGKAKTDVYFPFYWRLRDPEFKTDIVLQTYYNRSKHGYNLGFGPLFFAGKDSRDKSGYQIVPPLFWNFQNKDGGLTLAGIYYDHRDRGDYDRGLPPLFFAGRNRDKTYLLVLPPLFWHFSDEVNYKTTTVVPPLFYKTRKNGWSLGLLPLFYLARDKNWARTLVTPFYYGSRWGEGRSYYIPPLLSYYKHSPTLSQGGIALFYHWYKEKGDYLNMYTPLVWRFGNERTGSRTWMIPPLVYRHDSPVTDNTMVGLIYWDFHEHHRERTLAIAPFFVHNWNLYEKNRRTWIAPTFDFGVNPDGYHFRLHPLFYLGQNKHDSHLVIPPLLWHFKNSEDINTVLFPLWWNFKDTKHHRLTRAIFPLWWQFDDYKRHNYKRIMFPLYWDFNDKDNEEHSTVVAPIFWRDKDKKSTMTGVLNIVHHKGEIKKNKFWTFQFFPFLAFGKPPAPESSYWSILGGFAGWRRQGSTKELKILWIPFNLSDDDEKK